MPDTRRDRSAIDAKAQSGARSPCHAGIGLRPRHYRELLAQRPRLALLEVHSENYFGDGGQPLVFLEKFRERYPLSLHGVGASLGSADGLDARALQRLKRLVDRIEPALVSEHLCWSAVDGRHTNDLLPLPYTEEALVRMVDHVDRLQTLLGRRVLIENISSYVQFAGAAMPEWAFLAELARRSGCAVLLDVNNIHVSASNHGFDPRVYIDAIDPASVMQYHLAGFDRAGPLLIDTHGQRVHEQVWALYDYALRRIGPRPTVIEWDTNLPALSVLLDEAARAEHAVASGGVEGEAEQEVTEAEQEVTKAEAGHALAA